MQPDTEAANPHLTDIFQSMLTNKQGAQPPCVQIIGDGNVYAPGGTVRIFNTGLPPHQTTTPHAR